MSSTILIQELSLLMSTGIDTHESLWPLKHIDSSPRPWRTLWASSFGRRQGLLLIRLAPCQQRPKVESLDSLPIVSDLSLRPKIMILRFCCLAMHSSISRTSGEIIQNRTTTLPITLSFSGLECFGLIGETQQGVTEGSHLRSVLKQSLRIH